MDLRWREPATSGICQGLVSRVVLAYCREHLRVSPHNRGAAGDDLYVDVEAQFAAAMARD
jgi:hypothetical protein